MNENIYETAFNEALKAHGLTLIGDIRNYYTLQRGDDKKDLILVKLVLPALVDNLKHGSHNCNELKTICRYEFPFPVWEQVVDYYVFAFTNTETNGVEFININEYDFRRRIDNMNKRAKHKKKLKLVFWLMPDGCLYETSNISVEGEWFWLSKGVNGRMADGESNDFTQFLNNWDALALDLDKENR